MHWESGSGTNGFPLDESFKHPAKVFMSTTQLRDACRERLGAVSSLFVFVFPCSGEAMVVVGPWNWMDSGDANNKPETMRQTFYSTNSKAEKGRANDNFSAK